MAHEVGHTLNLRHTNLRCGGIDPLTYWPFPNNLVQSSTGVYEYGFDTDQHAVSFPGTSAPEELMAYCNPRWVSPLSYDRMIEKLGGGAVGSADALVGGAEKPAAALKLSPKPDIAPPTLATGSYWQISGDIDPVNGLAFDPVFQQTVNGTTDPGTGTYSIEVLDSTNEVLYTRHFTPDTLQADTSDDNTTFSNPIFSEWIPVTPGAASLVVLDPSSNTIGTLPITGPAPAPAAKIRPAGSVSAPPALTVTITSPAAGFVGSGLQTISWTAQEANVSNFTSRILYSPDGGTAWLQQGDITGTSDTMDFSQLPGSTNALIQVLVSDGVNTGSATSSPFSVPNHVPSSVAITNPPDGYAQPAADMISLRGGAFDADDGYLPDSALSWSSDIQGSLGTGSPLYANLNPGTHKITLTATDSDGNAISTSVNVIIGGGRPTVSLTTSPLSANCISATLNAVVGAQGAPLSQVQYSLDGGASYTTVALNQLPFSFVVPGSGTVNVVLRAYDVSNQSAAQSAKLTIPAACSAGTPTISGGSAQAGFVGAAFANPLAVLVSDMSGNPVQGVVVNFTAPATGASATLSSASATTGTNGIASVTATANSTNGSYNIVAVVPGFSTTAQFALTNTDFTIAVSAPPAAIKPGSSANVTVTVTPLSGFSAPVTLSCSGLPDGVTCTNGSLSTDPVSGVITTSITITVAKNVKAPKSAQKIDLFVGSGGLVAFCLLPMLGRRRRKYFGLLLLLIVGAASCLMAGCGSQNTKPFDATISVTATAGPLQHVIPVRISIQ